MGRFQDVSPPPDVVFSVRFSVFGVHSSFPSVFSVLLDYRLFCPSLRIRQSSSPSSRPNSVRFRIRPHFLLGKTSRGDTSWGRTVKGVKSPLFLPKLYERPTDLPVVRFTPCRRHWMGQVASCVSCRSGHV